MSKPISQLDDLVNLSQFIVPGIEGTGPFTNSKGKLVTYFVPKTGGNFTGAVTVNGTPLVPEAPSDGAQYARKNAAWSPVVIPPTDWASIPGKPSTFPPTLPIPASGISGAITDAQHGNLSGGTLHALASGSTPGFMAAADKAKLDGIAAGATVGIPEAPNDGQQYARKSQNWAVVAQPPPATSIGDNPPASPVHGQQWWKSDTGNMFIYYNDGNTSQWVQVNIPAYMLNDYVPTAGGTVTGDLAVNGNLTEQGHRLVRKDGDTMTGWLAQTPTSAAAVLYLDKAVGAYTNTIFGRVQTAVPAKNRWGLELGDGVAESGSNVGTRLKINRFDDSGAYIDSPIYITREDGTIHLGVGNIHWASRTPSTDAWTLDDYREGTFVPVFTFGGASVGMTYATQLGNYTKIGRHVFCNGQIALSAKGTSTGNASLGGFPFSAIGGGVPMLNVGYFAGFVGITPGPIMGQSAPTMALYYAVNATGVTNLTDANFGASANLYFSCHYMTNQ